MSSITVGFICRGRKFTRGSGNGFKSRATKGRTGPFRGNSQSSFRGNKRGGSSGRGGWKKSRGGKSGGTTTNTKNKRLVGNAEQKE